MDLPVKTVVLLAILSLHILPADGQLGVAAFNIQKFGYNKFIKYPWMKDVTIKVCIHIRSRAHFIHKII